MNHVIINGQDLSGMKKSNSPVETGAWNCYLHPQKNRPWISTKRCTTEDAPAKSLPVNPFWVCRSRRSAASSERRTISRRIGSVKMAQPGGLQSANAQPALFPGAPRPRKKPERASFAAFSKFHLAHPDVYTWLVQKARLAKASGIPKYGIGALWEIMRWEFALARGNDPRRNKELSQDYFKLNNNHRAYYARMIMLSEPDLKDFFETRGRKLWAK